MRKSLRKTWNYQRIRKIPAFVKKLKYIIYKFFESIFDKIQKIGIFLSYNNNRIVLYNYFICFSKFLHIYIYIIIYIYMYFFYLLKIFRKVMNIYFQYMYIIFFYKTKISSRILTDYMTRVASYFHEFLSSFSFSRLQ